MAVLSLGGLVILVFLFVILLVGENYLYLPAIFKTSYFIGSFSLSLIFIFYLKRNWSFPTFKSFYQKISRSLNSEALRNVLDLSNQNDTSLLLQPAIKQNLSKLSLTDLRKRIREQEKRSDDTKYFRITGVVFPAIFSIGLLFAIYHPSSLKRSLYFWKDFQRPNPFHYRITPGNTVIESGAQIQIFLHIKGLKSPQNVNISVKTQIENNYRLQKMQKVNDSTFVSDVFTPANDMVYHVNMNRFPSKIYHIRVQLQPRFKDLNATIQPPAYTKLDSVHHHYPFTSLDLYKGSIVTIHGKTNKPVKKLVMVRTDSLHRETDLLNHKTSSDSLFTRFVVQKSDSVYFEMADLSGLTNDNPFAFHLNVQADQDPKIAIISPETPLSITQPDTVSIAYEFSDDFGFHSVTLHYQLKKAYVKNKQNGVIHLSKPVVKAGTADFVWNLKKLHLKPLDELTYWITVRDNDVISGYKAVRSHTQTIRMASLAETITNVDDDQEDLSKSLDTLKDRYGELQNNFQKFQNNLRNDPENTWRHKQDLKKITNQQEELNKKVDAIKKKFDKVKDKLQKNNLVSKETMKQYEKLQKLIKEIHDPAILKALRELQKSLNNIGDQQIQQALQNYKFNESVYKERIKRTIELFKSLKLNAELENMARNLQSLQNQEESLSKGSKSSSEQVQQQKNIKKNLQDLSKKLSDMKNTDLPERARPMIDQLRKKLSPSYKKADQNIQKNINELHKNPTDSQKSQQQQSEIAQQMNQMSQQIQKAQKAMNQKKAQVNLMALKSILQDLMLISNEQEKISNQVGQLSDGSNAFVEQARRQANISNSYSQVVDSLYKVSTQVPELLNLINQKKQLAQENIKRAQSFLADRDEADASSEVRTVLGNINDLSSMIASLIDQLQQQGNQGGGSGMSGNPMEALQQLSKQQRGLNDRLQNLINNIQGDRLTESQLKRFNQLARTQKQIRNQIQELQRSGGLQAGDKTLSDLQRLSDEMQDAINDMRGGSKDRPFIQRQQNILSRMLTAEKALQKRGKDKKRKSETADQSIKKPSPEMTMQELQKMLRKRLQSESTTQFSKDYQQIIQRYYELLQQSVNGGK